MRETCEMTLRKLYPIESHKRNKIARKLISVPIFIIFFSFHALAGKNTIKIRHFSFPAQKKIYFIAMLCESCQKMMSV